MAVKGSNAPTQPAPKGGPIDSASKNQRTGGEPTSTMRDNKKM